MELIEIFLKKLNIVLAVLIGAAIPYLLFSFVKMDLDSQNWSEHARFVCAPMMVVGALLGVFCLRMQEGDL